ncbi:unnamed protein product [Cylindrotheca closterium]|uniref:Dipeptidase n=1 Tax=Cylindrotheca closterium TaxID=2856 RepID=A0AAD2JK63_9STRA|nr:unnamed protein product [Cylindrotheca closterium]
MRTLLQNRAFKGMTLKSPMGCDTFVALYPATPKGTVVFGKNSDRPAGEGQSIQRYLGQEYYTVVDDQEESSSSSSSSSKMYKDKPQCQCTYISIPQAPKTHSVLLSQIDWMFGAEHGTNEHGVVIGNEAVWTKVEDEDLETKRLLGMDLVRLGLERGSTAKTAMNVITSLLEEHGQGGPCAKDDDSLVYHNSFLIADPSEAWIVETAGRHWVAKNIQEGTRNISNTLTIRTDYDLHSKGLKEYALQSGLLKTNTKGSTNTDVEEKLDWAACFGDGCIEECESPYSRQTCGGKLLEKYDGTQNLDYKAMMEILRNHDAGICMHGGFETTASMVSVLKSNGDHQHWMLDKPHPCKHEHELQPKI